MSPINITGSPQQIQLTRTRFCLSAASGSSCLPICLRFTSRKIIVEIYVVQSFGVVVFSLGSSFQTKPFQFSEVHRLKAAASKIQISFQGVCCTGLCQRKGRKKPQRTTHTIFNQVWVLQCSWVICSLIAEWCRAGSSFLGHAVLVQGDQFMLLNS